MITLELEINEVNGVLTALGNMPFSQVAPLIQKIQLQAQPQVKTNGADGIEAPIQ